MIKMDCFDLKLTRCWRFRYARWDRSSIVGAASSFSFCCCCWIKFFDIIDMVWEFDWFIRPICATVCELPWDTVVVELEFGMPTTTSFCWVVTSFCVFCVVEFDTNFTTVLCDWEFCCVCIVLPEVWDLCVRNTIFWLPVGVVTRPCWFIMIVRPVLGLFWK